jgi:predicted RNA-binding Zn-ribbon protein involved in translation (DUF1610 family)
MNCPSCGHRMKPMHGAFLFTPPVKYGGIVTIPDSNWDECPACGELLVSLATMRKIQDKMRGERGWPKKEGDPCGTCGTPLVRSERVRMEVCPKCASEDS